MSLAGLEGCMGRGDLPGSVLPIALVLALPFLPFPCNRSTSLCLLQGGSCPARLPGSSLYLKWPYQGIFKSKGNLFVRGIVSSLLRE